MGGDRPDPFGETQADSMPAAPRVTVQPGTTIGRFVVERKLGEGAMGVVLQAADPTLGRSVAIKLVSAGLAGADAQSRLLREAQGLAKLSHPNVVAVFEAGVLDAGVYLVMEMVDGTNLREWLASPRSWSEVLRVFANAGAGLAAAHRSGLVHRDFKPDNVLVGNDGRARVADFGLVGLTGTRDRPTTPSDRDALNLQLTRTGTVMGTPMYMAPEQHFGHAADARADQFAFCVALYEGLYGHRPFAGSTYHEIVSAVSAGIPITPQNGDVPAYLFPVIARGISADPNRRFPAMQDLLAALAMDPTVARRRRRRTALLVGAGILALLVIVGAVVFTVMSAAGTQIREHRLEQASEARARNAELRGKAAGALTGLRRISAQYLATNDYSDIKATLEAVRREQGDALHDVIVADASARIVSANFEVVQAVPVASSRALAVAREEWQRRNDREDLIAFPFDSGGTPALLYAAQLRSDNVMLGYLVIVFVGS